MFKNAKRLIKQSCGDSKWLTQSVSQETIPNPTSQINPTLQSKQNKRPLELVQHFPSNKKKFQRSSSE